MNSYDVVLVGAGIMSATLATLLHELDPDLRMLLVERLEGPAQESSAAVNNAGTGHAANCELNYTPLQADGTVATTKALAINAAFETSLQFWASLAEQGQLNPGSFLHQVPHLSAVWGAVMLLFCASVISSCASCLPLLLWSGQRMPANCRRGCPW